MIAVFAHTKRQFDFEIRKKLTHTEIKNKAILKNYKYISKLDDLRGWVADDILYLPQYWKHSIWQLTSGHGERITEIEDFKQKVEKRKYESSTNIEKLEILFGYSEDGFCHNCGGDYHEDVDISVDSCTCVGIKVRVVIKDMKVNLLGD